ncbi:nucleoside 2-deoxyribosyltransferase [Patescibacteria group bacterium]|nr:nucleoside 2-deoxyribosyltransferase [Patescibacteria group bacterium]MBU2263405.1 nucleoside 2-deoxyribosyltransferase [Patescibacteria group bacterium]
MNPKPVIYFAAAIRGNRQRKKEVINLIQWLKRNGVIVLTEHVGEDNPIEVFAQKINKTKNDLTAEDIERRDINWLNQAEYVIAEISGASTGVGREIEYARTKGSFGQKSAQILCLYHQEEEFFASPMIRGMTKDRYKNITISSYKNLGQAKEIIKNFLGL